MTTFFYIYAAFYYVLNEVENFQEKYDSLQEICKHLFRHSIYM